MIPLITKLVISVTLFGGGLWIMTTAVERSMLHRDIRWMGFCAGVLTCGAGCLGLADAFGIVVAAVGR